MEFWAPIDRHYNSAVQIVFACFLPVYAVSQGSPNNTFFIYPITPNQPESTRGRFPWTAHIRPQSKGFQYGDLYNI